MLRRLILAALGLFAAASAVAAPTYQATPVEGVRVLRHNGGYLTPIIFINTYSGEGITAANSWESGVVHPPGQWTTFDATVLGVPTDATGAWMSGILIITPGSSVEATSAYDLHVAFRAPGDTLPCNSYSIQIDSLTPQNQIDDRGQTVVNQLGGGMALNPGQTARVAVSKLVPLVNGKFEMCWTVSTPVPPNGQWPQHASYGINFNLEAYVR